MSSYGKGPKVPLAICHLWFYVFYTRSLVCLESGCEACIYPALVDYFPQMVTPTVNTFNWIIYLFPIDSKCYFYHETNFHYLFYFWTFLVFRCFFMDPYSMFRFYGSHRHGKHTADEWTGWQGGWQGAGWMGVSWPWCWVHRCAVLSCWTPSVHCATHHRPVPTSIKLSKK